MMAADTEDEHGDSQSDGGAGGFGWVFFLGGEGGFAISVGDDGALLGEQPSAG